jgi:hypothetical protein
LTQQAGPFSPSQYETNNEWFEDVNGNFYHAFAGNDALSASQGIVVVVTGPVDDPSLTDPEISVTAYPTPTQDGSLSIVSVTGGVLDLRATDGTTFNFDLASGAYS